MTAADMYEQRVAQPSDSCGSIKKGDEVGESWGVIACYLPPSFLPSTPPRVCAVMDSTVANERSLIMRWKGENGSDTKSARDREIKPGSESWKKTKNITSWMGTEKLLRNIKRESCCDIFCLVLSHFFVLISGFKLWLCFSLCGAPWIGQRKQNLLFNVEYRGINLYLTEVLFSGERGVFIWGDHPRGGH